MQLNLYATSACVWRILWIYLHCQNMNYYKVVCKNLWLGVFVVIAFRVDTPVPKIRRREKEKREKEIYPKKLIGYNLFEIHYIIINKIGSITSLHKSTANGKSHTRLWEMGIDKAHRVCTVLYLSLSPLCRWHVCVCVSVWISVSFLKLDQTLAWISNHFPCSSPKIRVYFWIGTNDIFRCAIHEMI